MNHWKVRYIGETIKKLRMRNQLSQEDLAWRSSLDRKTTNKLETNSRSRSPAPLGLLLMFLNWILLSLWRKLKRIFFVKWIAVNNKIPV